MFDTFKEQQEESVGSEKRGSRREVIKGLRSKRGYGAHGSIKWGALSMGRVSAFILGFRENYWRNLVSGSGSCLIR